MSSFIDIGHRPGLGAKKPDFGCSISSASEALNSSIPGHFCGLAVVSIDFRTTSAQANLP